jgi:DNA-directed RNA polymerase specialized sigma subunit
LTGDYMDAKQFLRQIRQLDQEINSKLEEVEKLRSLAEKMTSTLSHDNVSQSGCGDRVSEVVAKIVDLDREITRSVDRMIDLKDKAIRLINQLDEPNHRLVLILRYINGYTWEQIAVKMGYVFQWVHVLHGRALREFAKLHKS